MEKFSNKNENEIKFEVLQKNDASQQLTEGEKFSESELKSTMAEITKELMEAATKVQITESDPQNGIDAANNNKNFSQAA